jgi:hypothetical protein
MWLCFLFLLRIYTSLSFLWLGLCSFLIPQFADCIWCIPKTGVFQRPNEPDNPYFPYSFSGRFSFLFARSARDRDTEHINNAPPSGVSIVAYIRGFYFTVLGFFFFFFAILFPVRSVVYCFWLDCMYVCMWFVHRASVLMNEWVDKWLVDSEVG